VSESPSSLSLMRGLRRVARNWYWIGPLCWMILPSRFPPRRGLIHTRLGRRPVTVRLRSGRKLQFPPSEFWPLIEVYVLREYQRRGIDWKSAKTVVDVGANVGMATLWVSEMAPQARIISIEPSPSAFRWLSSNVRNNYLEDRVVSLQCALGATPGLGQLVNDGSAAVYGRVTVADERAGASVAVRTLESVLEEQAVSEVDVLKLDCEGAEFEILETAPTALLGRVRAIVGEFHAWNGRRVEELAASLRSNGFDVSFDGGQEVGFFTATRLRENPTS